MFCFVFFSFFPPLFCCLLVHFCFVLTDTVAGSLFWEEFTLWPCVLPFLPFFSLLLCFFFISVFKTVVRICPFQWCRLYSLLTQDTSGASPWPGLIFTFSSSIVCGSATAVTGVEESFAVLLKLQKVWRANTAEVSSFPCEPHRQMLLHAVMLTSHETVSLFKAFRDWKGAGGENACRGRYRMIFHLAFVEGRMVSRCPFWSGHLFCANRVQAPISYVGARRLGEVPPLTARGAVRGGPGVSKKLSWLTVAPSSSNSKLYWFQKVLVRRSMVKIQKNKNEC